MSSQPAGPAPGSRLEFPGGAAGALVPFGVFLAGVAWLGLSGAPDERGFWPVLVLALAVGLGLARDRRAAAEAILHGMARPIVMLMVLAWLLAGVLGAVLGAAGLVDGLVALARAAGVAAGGYVAAAFAACALVSTATGTSLGTLLVAGPILYPAGGPLGADPAFLIGAILAGSTFGDSISPVSDTTIASATTQHADLGGTVRSRLKYVLPAAALAAAVYFAAGGAPGGAGPVGAPVAAGPGSFRPLLMLLVPALVLGLLFAGRHLLEGLLAGIVAAVVLGLAAGLIEPAQVLHIDRARFGARGLVVEGMERGVGASVFTLLLMGLVGMVERSGLLDRLVEGARHRARGVRAGEAWIVGALTAVMTLTTHSVVAILTVGDFTRETGTRLGIGRYRRANLLDVTACTLPFLLPFFIPTVIAASTTAAGDAGGMPRLGPWDAGLHNVYSWGLVAMVAVAVATGFGRGEDRSEEAGRTKG